MTEFEMAMEKAIKAAIRPMKREGVCGMSLQNLKQVTSPPANNLPGAPAGTNAVWAYDQIFREVCAKIKVKGFDIYDTGQPTFYGAK